MKNIYDRINELLLIEASTALWGKYNHAGLQRELKDAMKEISSNLHMPMGANKVLERLRKRIIKISKTGLEWYDERMGEWEKDTDWPESDKKKVIDSFTNSKKFLDKAISDAKNASLPKLSKIIKEFQKKYYF